MASKKRDGLYRRGRFWWIRTDPIDGKPRSTGYTDREAARLWRAERERKAADPRNAAAAEARLDDWIGRQLAMTERSGSAGTVEFHETKLGHFKRIWGADCRLLTIDAVLVDAYVQRRRGEDASEHTISKEVGCLVRLLRLAKRAGAYMGDLDTIKPLDLHTGYKPRTRALSRAEFAKLLAVLAPERAALVAVCVALGCRRSEALGLTRADVDLDRGIARIAGTKTDGADRSVPILSVFRSVLEAALPHLPFKWGSNVNREIYWACKRAGVEHCSFNDFRRTHATMLLELGVDRDHIRRLLGHTTAKLVDTVYGQPKPEAIAALVEPRLLGAAPIAAATNTLHSMRKLGRPQRESNSRYRRERPLPAGVWLGRKRLPHDSRRLTLVAAAGDGRASPGIDASTLHGLGPWALAYAARSAGVLA